jgi:hypothetical protein
MDLNWCIICDNRVDDVLVSCNKFMIVQVD